MSQTISCKMCGGSLLIQPGSRIGECEFCGTLQTIPLIDDEKKLRKFERANRLRRNKEFDKASGIYESIVDDCPDEAEAYWGMVLCRFGIEYVDDPATGKKIPTCHRTSFTTVMEDEDCQQAMENSSGEARKLYRAEAKQIEELRKRIIEVSSQTDPFDIFICYKETDEQGNRTVDSLLAQDIYDMLTREGYRVFFSRITLEDKLGSDYEPLIFSALNSSKIMLAVGTDYDHFDAVWVKNEWSRFLKLMTQDNTKTLIPCYKGITPNDFPPEFAKLQAQDLGKVGALQDLLRGIKKILNQPVSSGPSMQDAAQAAVRTIEQEKTRKQVENAVSLGIMALDAGDTRKAISYFEEALKLDSESIGAYLGLVRCNLGLQSAAPFVKKIREMPIEKVLNYVKENITIVGDTKKANNLLTLSVWLIHWKELVLGLLNQGISPNAKHALMYAIKKFGTADVVNAFLDKGASVSDTMGWNYDYKCEKDKTEMFEQHIHTALSLAIEAGMVSVIKKLIDAGANVNHQVKVYYHYHYKGEPTNGSFIRSYSIVNMAVRKKDYALTKLLLEHGANPNVGRLLKKSFTTYHDGERHCEYDQNYSNLSDAIWNIKDHNMVKLLLEYRANPNQKEERCVLRESGKKVAGSGEFTPLIDAIFYSNDINNVKVLLQAGAAANTTYKFTNAAYINDKMEYVSVIPVLGLAVETRKKEVVQLLLEAGATFSQNVEYRYKGYKGGYSVWFENIFPLSQLKYADIIAADMGPLIRGHGWKGSKAGFFSKEHTCSYSW